MKKRALVGLSSPTFYDYHHLAPKAANDTSTSPNPIVENVIGLAVFYDEIWFACESLCPASIRGQPNVKYLDRDLQKDERKGCVDDLRRAVEGDTDAVRAVAAENFQRYWPAVEDAGAFWTDPRHRRIDNHTHSLRIDGVDLWASSNMAGKMLNDLACARRLGMDLVLNTFNLNIYNCLFPNQFDPLAQSASNAICGSALIRCEIPNAMTRYGPSQKVFEYVSNSPTRADFRRYIADRSPDDAYRCYTQYAQEIESHTLDTLRRSAEEIHPVKGIVKIFWDALAGLVVPGPAQRLGRWYVSQVDVPPDGAAAFLYELRSRARQADGSAAGAS